MPSTFPFGNFLLGSRILNRLKSQAFIWFIAEPEKAEIFLLCLFGSRFSDPGVTGVELLPSPFRQGDGFFPAPSVRPVILAGALILLALGIELSNSVSASFDVQQHHRHIGIRVFVKPQ